MNEASFLENLLDGAEVKYKPLEDVCDFKNGFAFKSNLFRESGLPIIRITNVDGKSINLSDVKYFNPEDYRENTESYKVSYGDVLIAMSGATTGKIGFYAHKDAAYLNQRVGKFLPKKDRLNNRYLYHYLLSKIEAIYILAGGGAQPNLSSNALMEKIEIPIPCPDDPKKSLAIQAEIVRILDAFTALTAELTAELTARKKQYNYYRDQLLTFSDGEVEWKTLGDIARIKNGKDHKALNEGNIPVYGSGGIMRYVNTYAYNKPSVLIPRKGSLGNLFYVDTPFWNVDTIFYTEIDEKQILPKFFYYFLTTAKLSEMNQAGGVPSQTQSVLNKVKIPIPYANNPQKSLAEQARIVNILDKFDALTNSISEGLPREIELRQKQYEYYRDLLLNFPKPIEEAA